MKNWLLGLTCTLLLFVGCTYSSVPPHKFVKYDKVLVTDAAHPPKEGSASIGVGIVLDTKTTITNDEIRLWYHVEFADGTSHNYKQEDLTLLERFSFDDDTVLNPQAEESSD